MLEEKLAQVQNSEALQKSEKEKPQTEVEKETHTTKIPEKHLEKEKSEEVCEHNDISPKKKIQPESLEKESLGEDSEKEVFISLGTDSRVSNSENEDKFDIGLTFDKREAFGEKDDNFDSSSFKKEFSKTCVTPKSPKFNSPEENKNNHSSDRLNRLKELHSEDRHHLDVSNSPTNLNLQNKKSSGHFAVTRGLLQDKASSVTGNQSSDMMTAYFHSNCQKSINSNDSPLPVKEISQKRNDLEDPIHFLQCFDLLFEV